MAIISYTKEGKTYRRESNLVVIACDPRNLVSSDVLAPTSEEKEIFDGLVNYKFHTTLLEVDTANLNQQYVVIFAPTALDKMEGAVYGYRNETAKQFGLEVAKTMTKNLITVYQLRGIDNKNWDKAKFEEELRKSLSSISWWYFGVNYSIKTSVTTPYFNHYDSKHLAAALPWKWLGIQGDNDTIYVHASTCFESVYDIWAYENLMLDPNNHLGACDALPVDKNAPITILGAGPSGLLMAERLKRFYGYTDVLILEKTNRIGGKTHTITANIPHPDNNNKETYCELGTCYLSPSYDPFVSYMKDNGYLTGNLPEALDTKTKGANFRGIYTEGQLPSAPCVLPYSTYVLKKAEKESGQPFKTIEEIIEFLDLEKYDRLHKEIMGNVHPMPLRPPMKFLKSNQDTSFFNFLKANGLTAMAGMLQYGYEVQGYGPIHSIPAYYGFIWFAPAIVETIIHDSFQKFINGKQIPIVTAFPKGWGNVWEQLVEKTNLKIELNIEISKINRS